jgi:hypothetical protein
LHEKAGKGEGKVSSVPPNVVIFPIAPKLKIVCIESIIILPHILARERNYSQESLHSVHRLAAPSPESATPKSWMALILRMAFIGQTVPLE